MTQPHNKKKNRFRILIYPSFQLDLILRMVALSLVLIGLLYLSQWYFFHSYWNIAQKMGLSEGHIFFRFLEDQRKVMNLIFWTTSSVMLGVIATTALVLSHRVAGPLIRIKAYLDENAESHKKTPFRFRKKDYFSEIATSLNHFISKKGQSHRGKE